MRRLHNGVLLCVFEQPGRIEGCRSADSGRTWTRPTTVVTYPRGQAANPELAQLADGSVLCLYNERPRDGVHRFAICLTRLDAATERWSAPQRLYTAGVARSQGCWEPALVQLPSGELHLLFANEAPYRHSDEQAISLLRSEDGGRSWSGPSTVSFRPAHRDGMPVPCLLANGRDLVVAIEDNGLSGRCKPVILRTSLAAPWAEAPIGPGSPNRWRALREPLPPTVYAGAPYLVSLPAGGTLLSFQTDGGPRRVPQMVVSLGDADARHFGPPQAPFDLAPDVPARWNSLCVLDRHTVWALSTTTVGGVRGLWAVTGHVTYSPPGDTAGVAPPDLRQDRRGVPVEGSGPSASRPQPIPYGKAG